MLSLNNLPQDINKFANDSTTKLNIENITNVTKGLLNIINPIDEFLKCKDGSNLNIDKCLSLFGTDNFEICQDIRNNGTETAREIQLLEYTNEIFNNLQEELEEFQDLRCLVNREEILSDIISRLQSAVSNITPNSSPFIECIININIKEKLKNLLNKIIGMIQDLTIALKTGFFKGLLDKIKGFVTEVITEIEDILNGLIKDIFNYLNLLKLLIGCILNIGGRTTPTSKLFAFDNPLTEKALKGSIREGFSPVEISIPTPSNVISIFN